MTVPEDNWVVEWTYCPSDYFEEPVEVSRKEYDLTIKNGKAEARTSCDPQPQLCDQLTGELEFRFQGVQLVSHRSYELSAPSVIRHHANGKRTQFLAGEIEIKLSLLDADLRITDKNGIVVADTRAERIQKKRSLSTLAAEYGPTDPFAGELLLHYSKAVNDHDHFLVHLYDIIDALMRHFRSEKRARTELQVTKPQWSALCRLANKAPLREGRHRALAEPSELRNATHDERDTAMNIAAEMVEKYLKYLDDRRT